MGLVFHHDGGDGIAERVRARGLFTHTTVLYEVRARTDLSSAKTVSTPRGVNNV